MQIIKHELAGCWRLWHFPQSKVVCAFSSRHYQGEALDFKTKLDERFVHSLRSWQLAQLGGNPNPIGEIRRARQMHMNNVVAYESLADCVLEADAVFSSEVNSPCAVSVADCVPICIFAADGSVVAAVHAGWRSLASSIIEKTVDRLHQQSTDNISLHALIGPFICQQHFRVGISVAKKCVNASKGALLEQVYMQTDVGGRADEELHGLLDLQQLVKVQLQNAKVGEIIFENPCTYSHCNKFYSARRYKNNDSESEDGRMVMVSWRY